jgi:hypothetical protein
LEIETPAGAYVYVSVDVDSVRVASAASEVSEGPAELKDTKMIATIEVSGAADDVL